MKIKIALISFIASCLLQTIAAQEILKGDQDALDQLTKLKTIPSFDIRDKEGNVYKLDKYINDNKLHTDKPILIALWGTNGSRDLGVSLLNALDSMKLGDKYNIVALCVSFEKDKSKQGAALKELLTTFKVEKKWNKFLLAVTDWGGVKNFYVSTFPYYIFADANMNVVGFAGNGETAVKEKLEAIQKGRLSKDENWYAQTGGWIDKTSAQAHYYIHYTVTAKGINNKQGTKTQVLFNYNYIKSGDDYFVDGVVEQFYESGKPKANGAFKAGIPITTYKQWTEDGKISTIIPVDGSLKMYDDKGEITFEGPMKNGLGEGVFTQYNEGAKVRDHKYVAGEKNGLQTEYLSNGRIMSEKYESPTFDTDVYAASFSEGLQSVKIKGKYGFIDRQGTIKIPAMYHYAGSFTDGMAHVRMDDKDFYINRKGERISKVYNESD